jgi:hypothetical protein
MQDTMRGNISRVVSINTFAALLRDECGVRISGPTLNDITLGVAHSTRRSVRDGIAKLAGYPFTSDWLSGAPDSELDAIVAMADAERFEVPTPVAYNVEGLRLLKSIQDALIRDWNVMLTADGLEPVDPANSTLSPGPDTDPAPIIRTLLSVAWWRRLWIGEDFPAGLAHAQEDIEEFARGIAQAIRALLAPWLRDGHAMPLDDTARMFQWATQTIIANTVTLETGGRPGSRSQRDRKAAPKRKRSA